MALLTATNSYSSSLFLLFACGTRFQWRTYRSFLDRVGYDFAGDGDIDGVLLVGQDGEHDEQVAYRDAALVHIPIFPRLYAWSFVRDTEVVANPHFPLYFPKAQFFFHSFGE